MALVNELERQGNYLFKYRGQFPVLLFLLAIPFIYLTDTSILSEKDQNFYFYIGVALSFIGFWTRAYTIGTTPKGTSGRNTKEQVAEVLNSTGIYSIVRHPLYLGNYFIWIGIVVFTYNPYLIVIISLLYWVYYERIMYAEECFLERKFGQKYLDWADRVPAFIPSFKLFKKSNISFSFKSILRREYSGFLAAIFGFTFVDIIRNYFLFNKIILSFNFIIVLLIAIIISLILKFLKKNTDFLV